MARPDQLGPEGLILVANPGSASRKYALYDTDLKSHAELHFETENGSVVYTLVREDKESRKASAPFSDIHEAAGHLRAILKEENLLTDDSRLEAIGLRIVAPSADFMRHQIVTDELAEKLASLRDLAPIHIGATLAELDLLRKEFPDIPVVGVSDSEFHRTKPGYAWNYGINLQDADRFDIKRFGYHGLSVKASVDTLWNMGKLPPKVIVCHLGSGSSISGVFHGHSIDTTMGYTPLEGVVMATRSGDIGPDAARALQHHLKLDNSGLEAYLNEQSGLLGLGGSNDIRELLEREKNGDHLAHLALTTLLHTIHKAIGGMMAALNGCDLLVFTGTVGERSFILRKRIVAHLEFADFILDGNLNEACISPANAAVISQTAKSKPILVIPTNEAREIAKHTIEIVKKDSE